MLSQEKVRTYSGSHIVPKKKKTQQKKQAKKNNPEVLIIPFAEPRVLR